MAAFSGSEGSPILETNQHLQSVWRKSYLDAHYHIWMHTCWQQAMVSFHDCGMVVLSDIIQGCEIVFFLLNMLVTPLSPHIVQRTYIATSDADMRIVMGAMLLAPFIAQTPGIIMGLTKTLGWADGIQWYVKGEAAGCRNQWSWHPWSTRKDYQLSIWPQHLTF